MATDQERSNITYSRDAKKSKELYRKRSITTPRQAKIRKDDHIGTTLKIRNKVT